MHPDKQFVEKIYSISSVALGDWGLMDWVSGRGGKQ